MHCPTLPEAEWTRDGVDIFCICEQSAVLSHEEHAAARKGSAHTPTPVLFGLGSCLFLRKGQRRKIQDLMRCNVHRFYTPIALSNQRAELPKHILKGKGMLQAMQLKPFQMLKEGFCVGGPAILEWKKHFTFQMHIQI